ncbi:LOW QUALITY PROTEIN: RNA-binding protein Jag [Bacillus sp. JCM 19046]|nr:LOW QUALITY PROTEIN: RNA-binding protein Jag [Bacillus sp. JCM 19046]
MAIRTVQGRTIDEAVQRAMQELNAQQDQLIYDVIEQPKKGFLGLIGTKPAVIEVRLKPSAQEIASTFLKETITRMGMEVELSETKKGKDLSIVIECPDQSSQGRLIGRKGQTLDSLEYLTNLALSQSDTPDFYRIRIDVGGYRAKREETLKELALRVSKKAKQSKEPIVLEPMPARERKVIHTYLANVKGVTTESKGAGHKRHVVIGVNE